MADPRIEGRRVSYGQHPCTPASSSIGSYCSETSSCNSSHWHPKDKCKHRLRAVVKYAWTFLNPGRRFAGCPKEEKEQCDYFCWIDPEWDERSYAVMLKLMKKKVKAEEDAKQWEGELGQANCELREIRNELKIARQKLQKATAELKSIGNYRHNVKLTHVLLALFVVFAGMVGLMLGGKAN